MNKNERLFEDLRIPLEKRDAHEKRDNQPRQELDKLTREPHFDADTGKPIVQPGKEKKIDVGTTFLPGGPIDSLGRSEGPFKPLADIGHDQSEPKGPKRDTTPKEGGAQFGDQMGSSKPINWHQPQDQGQGKQGDQQLADKFAGKPPELSEQEAQGGDHKLMSAEEHQKALGWSKVTQSWALKDQGPKIPQGGEQFDHQLMSAEEHQKALGWSKVTQPWVKDRGFKIPFGQEPVKHQTPEFKDIDLSSGKEKRGELHDQGVLKEPVDKSVEAAAQPNDKEATDHQQNKPGILAGFRDKVKDLFRHKSTDTQTQGPKEFTPLDNTYMEGPIAKEQDKSKPLPLKEGDMEQSKDRPMKQQTTLKDAHIQ
jgi:hypothetical protein